MSYQNNITNKDSPVKSFGLLFQKKKEGKRRKVLSYRMHKKPRKTTTYEGILLFKVTQWNLVYKDIFE